MSGLRAIILVCLVAFFLGTLCTHWTADSLTMWNPPLTPEHLASAAAYYAHLAASPPYMLYPLAGLALAGLAVLLTNFWDWREASLFDWASLCECFAFAENGTVAEKRQVLYGFSGFIYLFSVIPSASPPPFISHQLTSNRHPALRHLRPPSPPHERLPAPPARPAAGARLLPPLLLRRPHRRHLPARRALVGRGGG